MQVFPKSFGGNILGFCKTTGNKWFRQGKKRRKMAKNTLSALGADFSALL
jgi:hypothetical protein